MYWIVAFLDTNLSTKVRRVYTDKTVAERVKKFLETFHPYGMTLCYDSHVEAKARELWEQK